MQGPYVNDSHAGRSAATVRKRLQARYLAKASFRIQQDVPLESKAANFLNTTPLDEGAEQGHSLEIIFIGLGAAVSTVTFEVVVEKVVSPDQLVSIPDLVDEVLDLDRLDTGWLFLDQLVFPLSPKRDTTYDCFPRHAAERAIPGD